MAGLFWLSDAQWAVMEPFMPKNQPGARRVDDRRTISGIVHVIRSGCRWQDCPRAYGPPTTIYNRFNRWSRRGFWRGMLSALAEAGWVAESASLDSTYIKAHRSAHGGKGGEGAGDRGLARRADHQSPRRRRRHWPAGRHPPHGGQRKRCDRCAASDCRDSRTLAQANRRSRLRRRSAPRRPQSSGHRAGHPGPTHTQAAGPIRPGAL